MDNLSKSQLEERKKYLEDRIKQLDAKQLSIKIFCNSCYGALGNKQAPIGDDDIASSITLTGQAVIKQAREIAKQYISEQSGVTDPKLLETVATYGDTDSYAADTKITTNHGVMRADELHKLYAKTAHIDQHGHEIYSVEDKNLQVTTFDSNNNKIVFGRVKNLERHRVKIGRAHV